ncbi:hypothetical protein DPMN_008533 [Dreissena polymorpha]|uniref:Uncharacterized protein n=1 Tax=Dreissena polymorpha TaxID=45954 RepID=A0A9D4RZ89_DREPO|nr:hypothetical protein DPMN_008533 [Dreissena polymorpha]
MNLLTEFHKDRTINVASRVKNAPPLSSHVFQANVTKNETIQDINKTNLLTKFHEDWTINVASRVLTRKNDPPLGDHVFQPTGIIFELVQDINGMNLLTKFHEDWTINVASRVKNAPPLGSHVFQAKFHEDRKINVARKTTSPPGGHVFSPIWTIFELVRDINETNVLTKFHDDWAKIVTSRVFTRNTAMPPGGHLHEDWASNVTSTVFELSRGINGTNVLTKFNEDRSINVAF